MARHRPSTGTTSCARNDRSNATSSMQSPVLAFRSSSSFEDCWCLRSIPRERRSTGQAVSEPGVFVGPGRAMDRQVRSRATRPQHRDRDIGAERPAQAPDHLQRVRLCAERIARYAIAPKPRSPHRLWRAASALTTEPLTALAAKQCSPWHPPPCALGHGCLRWPGWTCGHGDCAARPVWLVSTAAPCRRPARRSSSALLAFSSA